MCSTETNIGLTSTKEMWSYTVADPGEGGRGTPLFLVQTEAQRAEKIWGRILLGAGQERWELLKGGKWEKGGKL